ncbi:AGE family epimerase/isomerase [Tropicimonas sp. IMCC6043]|uniref:AGE family epimerase/isomerase n=1 Tax=Tropicimonas sp. IMCC6043 TaxID=2510645 RepID=UPI00101BA4F8|nr:AGE family epimerase/isomerase [Tropicimonas sp. IMCC6043]
MPYTLGPFDPDFTGPVLEDPAHRAWLKQDAHRQFDFFRQSLRPDGGFDLLDFDGRAIEGTPQELHTTTRLIHSYALGKAFGDVDCTDIIDAGMEFLWQKHRDTTHGGYVWSVEEGMAADKTKLAYGHVFVLLAASSAKLAGHPDADRLLADITEIIDRHFWDDEWGLLRDEFTQTWTPFSTYRGMNANMHGVEALLVAFEATGERVYLDRAGRILDFFVGKMAPENDWRLPEHYTESWEVDFDYAGNPMFRPAGTTPGHSLEVARLSLQHWDLTGRVDTGALQRARSLVTQALSDAWLPNGGIAYTLGRDGKVAIADRYWWPVTEGIGVLTTLLKINPTSEDEVWYRRLWDFADRQLIDHERGGWYPEIDPGGTPISRQFQ